MKDRDYFQIRECKYPEEKRIKLNMKKYEVYVLYGTHWEYRNAHNTKEEAEKYVQDTIKTWV